MCNLGKFRFSISLVGFILIIGGIALASKCDPNVIEPDFFVYGLCFSPYIDGQGPPDTISVEQIQERLAIITRKPHTQWIRTYIATNGFENIPYEAKSLGLKVAMGVWVRNDDETEIDNLVNKAQSGLVDIAVVGNEELHAGDLTVNELINKINNVRQRLADANCADIPVTTAEPFDNLFSVDGKGVCTLKYPGLIDVIDVVSVNIYPFHDGINIGIALADLAFRYQCAVNAVHQRDPNKLVIISETGWPDDGLTTGDAEPSLDSLASYFSRVSSWAVDNNVPLFYFEAFDENWKGPEEVEKHWGIWDSNGHLKRTLMPSPIFCETFDPLVNTFCPRREWVWQSTSPEPTVMVGDANSDGNFLRLSYDGTGVTHFSSAAFDRVAVGAFPRIVAEFDLRLYGPDANSDADGFSFMLIPTFLNGINGCSKYSPSGFFAEEPKLSKAFAVGFDVWQTHKLCVSWDGRWFPQPNSRFDIPFDIDDGNWHHVKIDLRAFDVDNALVTVILTPNILTSPGDPVVIVENLEINDPNHPYEPYENRVEFAGRNGGLDINTDIDNIHVFYKDICGGLAGDLNGDCRVNLLDLAIMANNWLVDCLLDPDNSSCAKE